MSQFDYGTIDPTTKTGTNLAADLNSFRTAINSQHKGSTAPSYAITGIDWLDDASNPIWVKKVFDGTDHISYLEINVTNNTATPLSLRAGAAATEALTVDQAQKGSVVSVITTGTSNAYLAAVSPAPAALAEFLTVKFKANFTNTGACTLKINDLTAKNIYDIHGRALRRGMIRNGSIYEVMYDGTQFILLGVVNNDLVNVIGSVGGGTQDIDLDLGRTVTATIDTSTTTFTFSNPKATGNSDGFILHLTNGGSQTVNWPASVDWATGTAPDLTASGRDILVFHTVDGGTIWNGFLSGQDMS